MLNIKPRKCIINSTTFIKGELSYTNKRKKNENDGNTLDESHLIRPISENEKVATLEHSDSPDLFRKGIIKWNKAVSNLWINILMHQTYVKVNKSIIILYKLIRINKRFRESEFFRVADLFISEIGYTIICL